jgi:hypothetical protein
VQSNRQFIHHERAATDALFDEVEMEMDSEADVEEPKEPWEVELQLPPMYLELGTELVDISDEDKGS